jgi:ATP-binding cassette subfamily B protein/subfamily B ATP-binding cassette protein MsbA
MQTKKPLFSDQDRENIRWFWDTYLKHRTPWLLLVLGMIIIQGFVYQQFLSLTETGLRVIFESGAASDLIKVCAIVFALFATRALMSYLVPRLSIWLASGAVRDLRRDLINHLMRLDLAYFEKTPPGDIILRLVNQAQELSQFVGQQTVNAVRDFTTIIIVSGYLIYKSPILFTTALIVVPMIVLLMQKVSQRIKDIQAQAQNAMGAYMSGIEEMSNGMRTVKISGQEPNEQKRMSEATDGMRDLALRLQAAQALVMPSIDLMSAFVYVLVIGGGGYMVLSGDYGLDGAGIITFLLGLVLVFDPARLLAQFFAKLQANLVILDGVRSLYREIPTIQDRPDAIDSFDVSANITLDNVSFRYSPDAPLFENLDMTILGGCTTAIVGATGSGKTTVLSLLTRLYNVQDGQVRIGDLPVEQIRIKALRSAFSVVAQDIVIFNNSIWENIRYVRPDATEEEIWAAAEAAEIAELIRARGDAPLGPKGGQLSGGQKQRIAIARAFLRDAPILLLDEATSALDQKTEDKVKTALARLGSGRTTIIVAHRLSSVTDADWIYVLDAGRIVEEGTHADLLAKGGLYAGMYGAQKSSYS